MNAKKTIAFFDTKPYDRESFDRANAGRYDIRYFETRLTSAAFLYSSAGVLLWTRIEMDGW